MTHCEAWGKLLRGRERDLRNGESEWRQHLGLLHDCSCRGINRRGSSTQLGGTVHRYRLTVDILCLFSGGLRDKTSWWVCKNSCRQDERVVFWNKDHLKWGFSFNRRPQDATGQAFLQVFLDLSQLQLQINSLRLLNPTRIFQLRDTLAQSRLPASCNSGTENKILKNIPASIKLTDGRFRCSCHSSYFLSVLIL